MSPYGQSKIVLLPINKYNTESENNSEKFANILYTLGAWDPKISLKNLEGYF